ncbi:MAG: mechanosensitive ion channel family protein [Corynebacterium sp.]|nr:mechanosensitive ion channel family protein [Corynebacterium sp.]
MILLILVAFLIPRAGRYAVRFLTRNLGNTTQEEKTRRALFSTLVYLIQIVLYIITFITILRELGFALNGVTIPAAFISAAAALGAQSVVADFLAGFFILSEKQFGVGDWVHFQGSSVDVQGDVIKMTMRATTVRTSNGETVIVPNSSAKLAINRSNSWARAVVDQPIPVVGGSLNETVSRATHAARRAIRRSAIQPDIKGHLDVLPATNFEKPVSTDMPWIVTVRFVVQATPARQWAVERAIRSALIDEFWDEYGEKNHKPVADDLMADAETQAMTAQHLAEHGKMTAKHRLPKVDVDFDSANNTHRQTSAASADLSVNDDAENEKEKPERQLLYTSLPGRIFSIGNRIRPTSTVLILITIIVLVVRMMVPPEETTTTNTTVSTNTNYTYVPPTTSYAPSTTAHSPEPHPTATPTDPNHTEPSTVGSSGTDSPTAETTTNTTNTENPGTSATAVNPGEVLQNLIDQATSAINPPQNTEANNNQAPANNNQSNSANNNNTNQGDNTANANTGQ